VYIFVLHIDTRVYDGCVDIVFD